MNYLDKISEMKNPLDRVLAFQIESRLERGSQKSRKAAEELCAILGRGVSPEAFARRLAIEIEDNGLFRSRSERIEEFANLLLNLVNHLKDEAKDRRVRDAR
jgi:hypothetical protein